MENSSSGKAGGITFCGSLTIAFIVLKLCNVIKWSWVWVLSPIWIPLILAIIVVIIVSIIACIHHRGTK